MDVVRLNYDDFVASDGATITTLGTGANQHLMSPFLPGWSIAVDDLLRR